MVVNRFFYRNPAFEQDEVLFELINPVCPWIKRRQSLFPAPFTVETMIIIKGNCGNQVAAKMLRIPSVNVVFPDPLSPATPRVKI